jgi:hypothetical protein
MALEQGNSISVPGLVAGAAITQYRVVKAASTAGQVINVTATSSVGIGICQNDPSGAGQPANVVMSGIAKAIAGTSTITLGESLGFDTTGRVMDIAINSTTATRPSIGYALESSAAAGNLIRVFVQKGHGGR